jgi:hypothetical protein
MRGVGGTMNSEKQMTIVDLMAKNEEAVSALYKVYADKFPERQDFWLSLSEEEVDHANWIRDLTVKANKGELYIDENRFNPEAIGQFLAYLDERLHEANDIDVALKKALSVAYDIENAMIEKQYFTIFTGDSAELKEVLKKLQLATDHHRAMVKEAMDSLAEQ